MGERIEAAALAPRQSQRVRRRLEESVQALQRMVDDGWLDGDEYTIGVELELDLVDSMGRPRPVNDAVLRLLARPDLREELDRFNLELNVAPCRIGGRVLTDLERELAALLDPERVERLGVRLAISLHAPDDAKRTALMPINARYPIDEVLAAARDYAAESGRRVSFEYVMLAGVNDSRVDA